MTGKRVTAQRRERIEVMTDRQRSAFLLVPYWQDATGPGYDPDAVTAKTNVSKGTTMASNGRIVRDFPGMDEIRSNVHKAVQEGIAQLPSPRSCTMREEIALTFGNSIDNESGYDPDAARDDAIAERDAWDDTPRVSVSGDVDTEPF